jgi:hypothetical protein
MFMSRKRLARSTGFQSVPAVDREGQARVENPCYEGRAADDETKWSAVKRCGREKPKLTPGDRDRAFEKTNPPRRLKHRADSGYLGEFVRVYSRPARLGEFSAVVAKSTGARS